MSIIQDFMDASADFCAGFVVICALMSPMLLLEGNMGVFAVIWIFIIIFCILIYEGEDDKKTKNSSKKHKNKKFRLMNYNKCQKCGAKLSKHHYICPHCGSNDVKRRNGIFNKKNKNAADDAWKTCPQCERRVYHAVKKCPHCYYQFEE